MTSSKIFKSKVFKAAWTSIRKGKAKNMSEALKSAWAWAKKTLTDQIRAWFPKTDFGRYYLGENSYVQVSIKERRPFGSYENHRACKGESFANCYYKLVNVSIEKFNEISNELRPSNEYSNIEWVASKF